nr:MAG TPA: hypothetical protein [Caudoviricetes sp.]
MIDPIAFAWAHCNPRVPAPESLSCRKVTETDEQREEEARQRKLDKQRKLRSKAKRQGHGPAISINARSASI